MKSLPPMKITKLGHCCLIVETGGVRFLTDPGAYTTEQNEVENIDVVVISHEHSDHLHVESLKLVLANNPKARVVCNASVGRILDALEPKIAHEIVADGQSIKIDGVTLSGHGTTHAPIFRDYEQVENTGYFFAEKFFYPGDAFFAPRNTPIDILAFPVTGPWCNIEDSMNFVLATKPRIAFPVHDGNLIRKTGITVRLPSILFPENDIKFVALELGKETEL